MTVSRKKVGQLTVRSYIRDGVPTGKWCLDVPAKIAGTRKRMLFENRREAEETAREVNRRVADAGVPAIGQSRNQLTFKEVADIWLEKQSLRVQTQKKRPGSLGADRYRLKPLLAYFGNGLASSIGEHELLEYQGHRLREGRKPATVNSEVGTLKHILKEATKQGAIAAAPEIKRIPQRAKAVTVPSEVEIVQLLKAAPPRLRLLLAFLAETGCRKGEALNLVWEAVNEKVGFVTIASRDG